MACMEITPVAIRDRGDFSFILVASGALRHHRGAASRWRSDLHVVVTGRNAKPELIALADGVTEMGAVKHHFAAGIKAQEGIEF